jgi:hypothetical protein
VSVDTQDQGELDPTAAPRAARGGSERVDFVPSERAPWLNAPGRGVPTAGAVAAGAAIAVAVVLRFTARSPLWLDEAQTVTIARLPLRHLASALRHDGGPPLYYALLHVWMRMFGTGVLAVRSLSALLGLAVLPVVWRLGHRIGGRDTAWSAALLLASSPFAVRYSTENRMYALVMLLSLVGVLVVLRSLERPTVGAGVAVAAVTALLLYSHYWCMYLVAAAVLLLLAHAWRVPGDRLATKRTLIGIGGGVVAFVPWLPVFFFQSAHTSTPWSVEPTFAGLASAVAQYGGGDSSVGWILGLLLFLLVILGVFGKATSDGGILLRARPRARASRLAAIIVLTMLIALAGCVISASAIAPRYTSVVFALWIVLAALGLETLASLQTRRVVLAVIVVLGLVASIGVIRSPRTEAGVVAAAIRSGVHPGDVVVYCPDQLGPAVSRLLPAGILQYTYPKLAQPQLVDWIDYRANIDLVSGTTFAAEVNGLAGFHDIWVVWSDAYRGTEAPCAALRTSLGMLRGNPDTVIDATPKYYENETLLRFSSSGPFLVAPPAVCARAIYSAQRESCALSGVLP